MPDQRPGERRRELITEQIIATRADVTLGGGRRLAGRRPQARTRSSAEGQAAERGYQLVADKAGLPGRRAPTRPPLLGCSRPETWPCAGCPEATSDGGKDPVSAPRTDRASTQPTLADMTTKAISLLDTRRGSKGFFLQVEGASIDKQDHAANACGQIGETVDLDEAVKAALAFAKKDGNTSVFVTADHAHTSQIVEAGSVTPGITVNLLTADNAPMTINYATAAKGASMQHTGTQLRVAGYGPGAANIVGLTDQTDLNTTIRRALGLSLKKTGR